MSQMLECAVGDTQGVAPFERISEEHNNGTYHVSQLISNRHTQQMPTSRHDNTDIHLTKPGCEVEKSQQYQDSAEVDTAAFGGRNRYYTDVRHLREVPIETF